MSALVSALAVQLSESSGAKRDVACARARILALLDRGTEALDQISTIPTPIG